MEQYIVSARKYRPSNFRSVIGQQSLTATLKNAIATQHLAHAYLFCGPRGVGKTTCARIFAKTINCMNLTAEGEACNACESCKSFNEQRSFNIHELDAASNNSVDDIRNLVEQVRIRPQIGKYSVYIIDEVHMLSNQAFNAFLKTLEEPPAHAIFILATTEKHKIIPTILSRCQIYDFNRIRVNDTVEHLQYVASQEGVTTELEALNVVAQKADGAMRDALSIFDQVVSFCQGKITYQSVIEHLNILDYDYYFRLVQAFLNKDVTQALLIFNEVLNKGFEAQYFIGGLAEHIRDVMVSRDAQTIPLLEVGEAIAQRYREQAQQCPPAFLYQALELSNECDLNYRQSRNKRLLVEVLLIRLCSIIDNSDASKKAKPELMKIAVATAPVINPVATAATPSQTVTPATGNSHTTAGTGATTRGSTPQPTATGNGSVSRLKPLPKAPTRPGEIARKTGQVNEPTAEMQRSAEIEVDQPFTEKQLIEAWCNYARAIDKEAHTTNIMLNFKPLLMENGTVVVHLVNKNQIERLGDHKQRILSWLRNALQNKSIELTLNLDLSKESVDAMTPEERFNKMLEENGSLSQLKQKLGLELQ